MVTEFILFLLLRNTSQAIKDSVADMDAMKKTILPLKKRSKHKAPKGAGSQGINSDDSESDDGLQKVHQDEDYSELFCEIEISTCLIVDFNLFINLFSLPSSG